MSKSTPAEDPANQNPPESTREGADTEFTSPDADGIQEQARMLSRLMLPSMESTVLEGALRAYHERIDSVQDAMESFRQVPNFKVVEDAIRMQEDTVRQAAEAFSSIYSIQADTMSEFMSRSRVLRKAQGEVSALKRKLEIIHFYKRVRAEAQDLMMRDTDFRSGFEKLGTKWAVVVSIDIRRSTDLMLKAVSAQAFSDFIGTLSSRLVTAIKQNFGIVDKFTGDGYLSFFPEFYSGQSCILHAIRCAVECHTVFRETYEQYAAAFRVVSVDTGLAIGIDAGDVEMSTINGEYTVVGVPVVYACRMSTAAAGTTILNEQARTILAKTGNDMIEIRPTVLSLKHDGNVRAHLVTASIEDLHPVPPEWFVAYTRGE